MVQVHAVSPGQVGTWIQVQMWSPPLNFTREEWREKEKQPLKKKNHIFLKEYKLQSDPDFLFHGSSNHSLPRPYVWAEMLLIKNHQWFPIIFTLKPSKPSAPDSISAPFFPINPVCLHWALHAPALCQAPAFQPRCLLPAQPAPPTKAQEHPFSGMLSQKHTHMDTHVHSWTHPSNPQ